MYSSYKERVQSATPRDCVVNLTSSCSLKGFTKQYSGTSRPLHMFLGVPFAAPPTGERRFQPPQELTLWSGERSAQKLGPYCPQHFREIIAGNPNFTLPEDEANVSEDCLYLNVISPSLRPDKPLPVMVYIHGGGFAVGYTGSEEGVDFAAEQGVVYVGVQYRLNLFGFFTTCDDVMPGNLGLWDQIEALKWVQKHIGRFGGDPGNVTLFGESAGAVSVSHLMLTAQARGLFHRAICQSGHSMSITGLQDREIMSSTMKGVLDTLGCTATDSCEIRDFLLGLDTETVLGGTKMFEGTPWVDGRLFTDKPTMLVRNPANPVDAIIGKNSHEGAGYLLMGEVDRDGMREMIKEFLGEGFGCHADQAGLLEAVLEFYAPQTADMDGEQLLQALERFGGQSFMFGLNKVTQAIGASHRTYQYVFSHRSSFTLHQEMPWVGADHADDVFYLIGSRWATVSRTEEEEELGRRMRAYWASFACTGVPSCPDCPEWKPSTKDSPCHMELSLQPQLKEGLIDAEAEEAWLNIIDKHVMPKHALSEK